MKAMSHNSIQLDRCAVASMHLVAWRGMTGWVAAPSWWLGQSEAQPYFHTITYIVRTVLSGTLCISSVLFVCLSRILELF